MQNEIKIEGVSAPSCLKRSATANEQPSRSFSSARPIMTALPLTDGSAPAHGDVGTFVMTIILRLNESGLSRARLHRLIPRRMRHAFSS